MKMKIRKGQAIEGLQALIGPIIGIALTLVIAFIIFSNFQTKTLDLTDATTGIGNITWTNNTFVGIPGGNDAGSLTCTAVYNGTNSSYDADRLIGATNYTCSAEGFKMHITDAVNQTWNASVYAEYTLKTSAAYNGTRDVTNATQEIAGWLPILVIVIIGILIVGLISMLTRKG